MDAGFGSHHAVGVVAGNRQCGGLDPGFLAILDFKDARLVAAPLSPAQVHAHQHLGPVLRFRTSGARMDIHDSVKLIVLSRKQELCLHLLDKSSQFGDSGLKLFSDRLSLARQFNQSLCIVHLVRDLPVESEGFFESSALLESLAGAVLVRPEAGVADQGLQFVELALA